jgi:hypothetical protein
MFFAFFPLPHFGKIAFILRRKHLLRFLRDSSPACRLSGRAVYSMGSILLFSMIWIWIFAGQAF